MSLYHIEETDLCACPGFFNFFIFIRVRYLKIRRENGSRSRLWAFCAIFRSPEYENSSNLSTRLSILSRLFTSRLSGLRGSAELGSEQLSSELAMVTASNNNRKGRTDTSTEQKSSEFAVVATSNPLLLTKP
jgi:hypothetical protein